jgi:hypothetical protein
VAVGNNRGLSGGVAARGRLRDYLEAKGGKLISEDLNLFFFG